MVDDEIIAELPVKELLEKDGIIVVWCTNAKSHQDALLKEFFPKWGVTHHKTMYWLKVRYLAMYNLYMLILST